MKPVLAIVFALLVIIPLVVIGWLSIRVAQDEHQRSKQNFDDLVNLRLSNVERDISAAIGQIEQEIHQLIDTTSLNTGQLRELVRAERFVRQVFVLSNDNQLQHPPLTQDRNTAENEFLERSAHIWRSNERFYSQGDDETGDDRTSGWYSWYFGGGVNLIYWKLGERGIVVGVEVERMALIAYLIGTLPDDSKQHESHHSFRIDLLDASSETIYTWGAHKPTKDTGSVATISLKPPLGAWRLEYFVDPDEMNAATQSGSTAGSLAAFAALILVVIGLAVYFFRESNRSVREASNKVTFVNQVSHELKTPLTNIRMYAELLEDQIPEDDPRGLKYLNVIVNESGRLSRLIANVLAFARQQKNKNGLRVSTGCVDDSIREIALQFKPVFVQREIELDLQLAPDPPSSFDKDILGQIVGNLLSNVEKYAGDGKKAFISSSRVGDSLEIVVEDRGPGIPRKDQTRIFRPFVRLNNGVTEGVSGTGIGLAIARDLAVLHGGSLEILPVTRGAKFKITLEAPLVKGDTP